MSLILEQVRMMQEKRRDMPKPLVIYHAHCTDGFGAAYAAYRSLGDLADYMPMNYDDKRLSHPEDIRELVDGRVVYVLDFSFPEAVTKQIIQDSHYFVWLDHHKTAFENWAGDERDLYVDESEYTYIVLNNSKSGALLAWEYFHPNSEPPIVIKHIDDRDRWQFKMRGSKEVHAALQTDKPWTFDQWDLLTHDDHYGSLFSQGSTIIKAQEQQVACTAQYARSCQIGDATGLCVNTNVHISEVGHELTKKSGTFGLVWYLNADNRANCSLRSEGDYDVSAIARRFGGGGHKNAAGFNCDVVTLLEMLK